MRASYIAILVGLSIGMFTAFYLLALLFLVEQVDFSSIKLVPVKAPTVTAQAIADVPAPETRSSPVPIPTTPFEEGLLVTDPRLVALDANDVPRDLKLSSRHTRYVDNARLIENSETPEQTTETLQVSGRLNGFQAAFISDDPVASQLRSTGILNFAEIYDTSSDARRALLDARALLAARLHYDGQLLFEREVTPSQPVGERSRAFRGALVTEQERVPLYAVIFCRKNTLAGIVLLGDKSARMAHDCNEFGDLIDRRIRDFGKGLAA